MRLVGKQLAPSRNKICRMARAAILELRRQQHLQRRAVAKAVAEVEAGVEKLGQLSTQAAAMVATAALAAE